MYNAVCFLFFSFQMGFILLKSWSLLLALLLVRTSIYFEQEGISTLLTPCSFTFEELKETSFFFLYFLLSQVNSFRFEQVYSKTHVTSNVDIQFLC